MFKGWEGGRSGNSGNVVGGGRREDLHVLVETGTAGGAAAVVDEDVGIFAFGLLRDVLGGWVGREIGEGIARCDDVGVRERGALEFEGGVGEEEIGGAEDRVSVEVEVVGGGDWGDV